jgi:hypothetical protein
MKPIDKPQKFILVHCNRCKSATRHALIKKHSRNEAEDFDEDGQPMHIIQICYAVWQCQGCESFTIEERIGYDYDDWERRFIPKRNSNELPPKSFPRLPEKLQTIYKESLVAFNEDARTLSAVGLRALIEGICKDRGITGKDLYHKIDGLRKELPENIVKNLHNLRFMGNDAAHELSPPPEYELRLGIDICEDLLNFLYELDYKTARLGKLRERRIQSSDKRSKVCKENA